jgi:hypothetical protein
MTSPEEIGTIVTFFVLWITIMASFAILYYLITALHKEQGERLAEFDRRRTRHGTGSNKSSDSLAII